MSETGKRDHDFERAVEGMDETTVLSMYYAQRNRAESAAQRALRYRFLLERAKGPLTGSGYIDLAGEIDAELYGRW